MSQYQYAYDPDSSYGSAVALVASSGVSGGVVLDLGCGYAAVAEPLAELGLGYVGVDVSEGSVSVLRGRGVEAVVADLARPAAELEALLAAALAGRTLGAVLALDSLEHLPEPEQLLQAVRALVPDGAPVPLIVSYPNVTHYDVAANLLAGRWRRTTDGLLDRTHLQFRDEGGLRAMMAAAGWHEEASRDVVRDLSDQASPSDSPMIRPGAPLNQLLRRIREDAWPTGSVFQFVRRYRPGPAVEPAIRFVDDEERPLVGVVVVVPDGLPLDAASPLLADLAAQQPPVDDLEVVRAAEAPAALSRRAGRWVVAMQATTRLDAGWSAEVAELARVGPGQVLRLATVAVDEPTRATLGEAPVELGGVGDQVDLDALDPLDGSPHSDVVVDAYLVPRESLVSAGIVPRPAGALGAEWVSWLGRAVQMSGIVGSSTPRVAVAMAGMVPPVVVAALVTEALDATPLLLPPGSARRLLERRERVSALEAQLSHALERAERAERHVDEVERALWSARHELEVALRPRSLHQRVLGRLRRLLSDR